ncbi:MAG: PEP-CTERM sorting domain-containing protein [Verrucomicrobiales bacterium]|jgi:hypothetical protein|nr:PEP-CTERM sorting domain-containing protein [Verrucomicrobiales bacterium]
MKVATRYQFKQALTAGRGALLIIGLLVTVSGAQAQWKWDATTTEISDAENWVSGSINFHFYYTGPEITYNIEDVPAFSSQTISGVDFSGISDTNSLSGYRISGDGLASNTWIAAANVSGSTLTINRTVQTTTATGGEYTLSNYGANLNLSSLTFKEGATVLNTGTYDARQMILGTLITGSGIAPGTYVTGVNNSGQITISQATTAASDGAYTVAGLRSYGKELGDANRKLYYTGTLEVPKNLSYINTYHNIAYIEGKANSKLVFTDPDAKFILVNAANSDTSFYVTGTLEFKGNATFAVNYGLQPANSGNAINVNAKNVNMNLSLWLNATTDVQGDFTKLGVGSIQLRGGASDSIVLHDGKVNILDGTMQLGYISGVALTSARIQGASEINLAKAQWTTQPFSWLFLAATEVSPLQDADVNLVDPKTRINLFNGRISFQGSGTKNISGQSLGDVYLKSGRSAIDFMAWGNNVQGFTVTLNSLNQQNGATVGFAGLNNTFAASATTGRIMVTNDANIVSGLVGGVSGTNYGAKNIQILPWATANPATTNQNWDGSTAEFVTYHSGSEFGFRYLAANEYYAGLADAAADDNVRVTTATTLSGTTQTINALRSTANLTLNSSTLTVTSGLLFSGNDYNGTGGVIDSGTRAFYLLGGNFGANITLKNSVSGSAVGLVASGNGITIGGTSALGGSVRVENAQLLLSGSKALSADNDVRLDVGARLNVNASVTTGGLSGIGVVLFNNQAYKLGIGGAPTAADNAGWITVHDGSFIAPGDVDGPLQAGALYLGSNIAGVKFDAGASLILNIADADTSSMLSVYTAEVSAFQNKLAPTLDFADGAILQFNFLDDYAPDEGSWLIASGFGQIAEFDSSKLILKNGDEVSDLFTLSVAGNDLFVNYLIPEPSTWALLLTGAALLVTLRRRR